MKKKKARLLSILVALALVIGTMPIHVYASATPASGDVTVENNAGISDKITINNLGAGDIVKVYVTTYTGTETPKVIGTVPNGSTSLTLTYAQLDPGDDGETIFVTVTSTNSTESAPLTVTVSPPGNSAALSSSQVTIFNNTGTPDILEVTNTGSGATLTNGDIVKVYSGASGNAIGVGYFSASTGKASVNLAQLLNSTAGGSVYVSLTELGLKESMRVEVSYNKEATSGLLDPSQVTITNNAVIPDVVKVTGLADGDTIKVYRDPASTSPLGSSKAIKQSDGTYVATVNVAIGGIDAGTLAVSLTNYGKLEGTKTAFTYQAAPKSPSLDQAYISVQNLANQRDTITVTNLAAGDIIKAYRLGSTAAIGSAIVPAGKTEASLYFSQLGPEAGIVYLTYTKLGYTESDSVEKTYPAEEVSSTLSAGNIDIINNYEISDVIKITGLSAGDVIKLYRAADGGTAFANTTVPVGKTEVTLNVTQLSTGAGSIFISLSSIGKQESARVEKTYVAEAFSASPTDITVVNNTGKVDTILVKGVTATDRIFVYSDATSTASIGNTTVQSGKTEATVSVNQLGTESGSLYVSIKSTGKMESVRTKADYFAETITDGTGLTVSVKNNAGQADVITVSGVQIGQLVKVYDTNTSVSPIVYTIATKTSIDLSYGQLGTDAGDVWVSVTTQGSRESLRVQKTYVAEVTSAPIDDADVTVVNHTGKSDTIEIKATANSLVFVYRDATEKTPIAKGLVPATGVVTLLIPNLGDTDGDIYVSVANKTENESPRTLIHYAAALTSATPVAANISIANNSGKADVITLTNLLPNDVIRVYRDGTIRNPIISASFPISGTSTTIQVGQLGQTAGSVYISVQSPDMLESARTKVDYTAEQDSTPVSASNVIIINNPGMDLVLVRGLHGGDLVKLYLSGSTSAIASFVVPVNTTYATFSIRQLGASGGSIDVTVTNTNCMESTKVNVLFPAE